MAYMKPIININGATRESHVQARLDARAYMLKAIEAMSELRPHGRDYLGDMVRLYADMQIYNERQAMLNKLYNELEMEALEISNSN
jgi:hypothetical protein